MAGWLVGFCSVRGLLSGRWLAICRSVGRLIRIWSVVGQLDGWLGFVGLSVDWSVGLC